MKSNTNISPNAIRDHFRVIHNDYKADFPEFSQFLEQHLFFVTASFDLRRATNFRSSGPTQLTEFRKLHFEISRYLLGPKLNRKRKLQPMTYAFMDFEGSRHGRSDPTHSELPHIHALILVAPKHLEKFNAAVW